MDSFDQATMAQTASDRQAQADAATLLPTPPDGSPPLDPIIGELGDFNSADVVGYRIGHPEPIVTYTFHGNPLCPGDEGFSEMILTRLTHGRLLPGVEAHTRHGRFLYARVIGNPILLEGQARQRGYPHALATAPGWLKLCEVSDAPDEANPMSPGV